MNQGNAPEELLSLQTKYWCREVVRLAKCKNARELAFKCNNTVELSSLAGLKWERYEVGEQKPLQKNLQRVEAVYGGTTTLIEDGPYGLPLWAVLAGDMRACRTHLDTVLRLNFSDKYDDVDIEKKARGILSLFHKDTRAIFFSKSLFRPSDVELRVLLNKNGLELTNSVSDAYEIYDNPDEKNLDFSMSSIIGVFALYNIGVEFHNKDVKNIAGYIIEGLLVKAIEVEFEDLGKELREYVIKFMPI